MNEPVKSLILVIFILFMIIIFSNFVSEKSCESLGRKMQLEVDHDFMNGCMLKKDGKWYKEKMLRALD